MNDAKHEFANLAADMRRAAAAWERIANAFERVVKLAEDDAKSPVGKPRPT